MIHAPPGKSSGWKADGINHGGHGRTVRASTRMLEKGMTFFSLGGSVAEIEAEHDGEAWALDVHPPRAHSFRTPIKRGESLVRHVTTINVLLVIPASQYLSADVPLAACCRELKI